MVSANGGLNQMRAGVSTLVHALAFLNVATINLYISVC
jgi:hypothetical protein